MLRAHRGDSRLRTYLVVVLDRLLVDVRRRRWGVWRPSAEARRLGPVAVRLDQLLHRDGLTLEHAIQQLVTNERVGVDEPELRRLALRLPARAPRREGGEDELPELSVTAAVVEESVLAGERDRRLAELRRCLQALLERLPDEDALVLRLRFGQGRSVVRIAAALGLEAKPLYRRIERVLRGLRAGLVAEGFQGGETEGLTGSGLWDESSEAAP